MRSPLLALSLLGLTPVCVCFFFFLPKTQQNSFVMKIYKITKVSVHILLKQSFKITLFTTIKLKLYCRLSGGLLYFYLFVTVMMKIIIV